MMAPRRKTIRVSIGTRPARRGFVLLLTLSLILVAGLMLGTLARRSLSVALEATAAHEELQYRWAVASSQRCVLNPAEAIFNRHLHLARLQEVPPADVSRCLSAELTLGGSTFGLRLSDEDAKVNLNTVYRLVGEARARTFVDRIAASAATRSRQTAYQVANTPRSLLPSSRADSQLAVRLRGPQLSLRENGPRPFQCWGQVFDQTQVTNHIQLPMVLSERTRDLTLWGSGRLNIYRASSDAVNQLWRVAIGSGNANQIQGLRRFLPPLNLPEMIDELALSDQQREVLEPLLVGESQTYSLWFFRQGGVELHIKQTVGTDVYTQAFLW